MSKRSDKRSTRQTASANVDDTNRREFLSSRLYSKSSRGSYKQ